MKLVRLTILEKFRSLNKIKTDSGFENFTILFREDKPNENWNEFHPYCFAGLNGTGKSNVLEALANIFYHLECCTLNTDYSTYLKNNFHASKSEPIAYELEYYIINKNTEKKTESNYVNIIIKKIKDKAPRIKITAQDQDENFKDESADEDGFIPLVYSVRRFLPELVIGYSSGENEILSLPFIKSRLLQLDEYYYHLKKMVEYNLTEKPESSLVYMDYHMSQAILLANFLLQDEDTLLTIKNQLDIEKLHSFRLVINNHKLYNEEEDKELGYLLPLVNETIDKFRKCSTVSYSENFKEINKVHIKKTEYLDFHVNGATQRAFKKYFKTPLQLFKAFQVLSLLNLRVVDNALKNEIYNSDSLYAMYKIPSLKEQEHIFHFNLFKIKKKGSEDKMLLKAFSDGEHQFLHTMGICLMLKDKNTLFLLDEPETHFNPEWRSEFIGLLKDSLSKCETNHLMSDIIITSHSPFIISDCYPDKVIVFEKGKQPRNARDLGIDTFGTSVNILTNKIFKRKNTIGNYSLRKLNAYRNRFLSTNNVEDLIDELNDEIGDSIEKLLFIKEMTDKKKE